MGIFNKRDDMGNKGRGGKGPKPMHRGRKYDNVEQEQQLTDEQYYDRGDYENSYGPNKYGHPTPAGKLKMPHAAQMRMDDMVAKVYGSPMPPSQQRDKSKAEKKQDFTTSGLPDFLYKQDGTPIDSEMIDEGNLSAIHRVHKDGPYVTPNEGGTTGDDKVTYNKGEKFFLKNPMAATQYKMPPSMKKHKKGGKAKAVKDTPKPHTPGQRP